MLRKYWIYYKCIYIWGTILGICLYKCSPINIDYWGAFNYNNDKNVPQRRKYNVSTIQ